MIHAATLQGWECLVGTPWAVMDCRAVVRAVYRLRGIELPPDSLERAQEGLWERTAHPVRELDVIASDPMGLGCESHLSVLVRARSPVVGLTSYQMGGCVTVRPWAIQRVLGVYRLRGVAP